MTRVLRSCAMLALALLLPVAAAAQTQQQQPSGPANALQGFSQNRDKPVHIEATTLEVRDKDKMASFAGNVRVTQGDTGLRCKSLLVFYDQEGTAAEKGSGMAMANPAGTGGQQKIKRLEARGGVIVTQKEQTVTGDLGLFDMATNTVTMSGNVVLTQGQNVLRGEKLVVNMTSGVSRVEGAHGGQGRVQGMFQPSGGGMPDLKPGGIPGQTQQKPQAPQIQQQAPQRQPIQEAPQTQQDTPSTSFPARSIY